MTDAQLSQRLVLACVLVVVAEYVALAGAGFVWDDFPLVACNALTGELRNIPRFFTMDLWMSIGPVPVESGYYRPLMLVSLAIDRALWGLSSAGHHLHSLAWHLAASLALFALLRRLVPPIPAALGMAFFALHPIQSEAIAWITARNDLLAATFTFAAAAALLPPRPSGVALAAGGAFAAGALFSKEHGVIVVPLLLLLDLAQHGRPVGWRRYLVLAAALALWLTLRAAAGLTPASLPNGAQLAFLADRSVDVATLYLGRLVAPWPLTVGYSLEYALALPPQLKVGAALALAGAALALARGRRLAAAGLVLALLAFLPALLPIASRGQLGERYLYLSVGGAALALAAALPAGRRALVPFAPLSLVFVLIVHERLPDWSDEIALWRAAVDDVPSGFTWGSLGHVLNGGATPAAHEPGACVPELHKRPAELARRDRAEAVAFFHRALREGDPPYRDVCEQAVRAPIQLGDRALTLDGIALTEAADCPVTPVLGSLRAMTFIELGEWERVRTELARFQDREDLAMDRGLTLCRAALARHDGDADRYAALRAAGPFAPEDLDRKVDEMLRPD